MKVSSAEQKTINELNASWVWVPNWTDSSHVNTAGRLVHFFRTFSLEEVPHRAVLRCSADTRYKLYVNGSHIAVGPCRSSPSVWYYDTIDTAPFLKPGRNEIRFDVVRYFAGSRAAMPFERTTYPGLTVTGTVETGTEVVLLDSVKDWQAQVNASITFPTGLVDDVFLHISERVTSTTASPMEVPKPYGFKTLNGDILPWRLRPRPIPMPEESSAVIEAIRSSESHISAAEWLAVLNGKTQLSLQPRTSHSIDIQAQVHSTAFLQWKFQATRISHIKLNVTYSEGYEMEPRSYPFFRTKGDRTDAHGHIIGPMDQVTLDLSPSQLVTYEPFWFRTFRLIRLKLEVGPEAVQFVSFGCTQVNYPLAVKASWAEPGDAQSQDIWDVSIRTMRNCMFDGYSDCPFYEQLQYSGDSRSVALFHYLLSGDDRLMRQTITQFGASILFEGLPQSRFPSHVTQLIAAFPLYWILAICDHHLYFGDTSFSRSFLPRIDGVLDFFASHVDRNGLVSDLPYDVWQYVDWVTSWGATAEHPDKGVPTSGRKSNLHTYFSLLYSYTLQQAATLLHQVGRPAYAEEYRTRARALNAAVKKHCFDGAFFTDSTANVADDMSYSQHCQVFAVLSGAVDPRDRPHLLQQSLNDSKFSKCSYFMRFYALRAFALAGDEVYEPFWTEVRDSYRNMLDNNLTTWEEDDVRQRSDCHAWGSVPIYEYCTELAGIQPIAPGCTKVLFKPRLQLSQQIEAKVALGRSNIACVSWKTTEDGKKLVELRLVEPVELLSKMPGEEIAEHGMVTSFSAIYRDV